MDNIYRYTLTGTEVSALLGRMPSAVGYQPTLAEEMGVLQNVSLQPKQVLSPLFKRYTYLDDLTDPSPATALSA